MMVAKTILLWCLAAIVSLTSAYAQDSVSSRVPTVTRLVKIFSNLEIALSEAQTKGNLAAMGELLTERFEMRVDARPGEPIPRAEWIKTAATQGLGGQIEHMAVHDFGDIAVVSFSLKNAAPSTGVFIVDVWRRAGEGWKLDTRYAASRLGETIPGAPSLAAPPFQKRY